MLSILKMNMFKQTGSQFLYDLGWPRDNFIINKFILNSVSFGTKAYLDLACIMLELLEQMLSTKYKCQEEIFCIYISSDIFSVYILDINENKEIRIPVP